MIPMLSWWLAVQLCALLALPLTWRLFRRLPSRGYPLAKALGLLLVAYVLWLGASFRLLPNDLGGILTALLVVAGLSLWLGRAGLLAAPDLAGKQPGWRERPLPAWLRANLTMVITTEVLFLVTLAAWTFFRAHSGEIAGTEKPMEFAFINGVLNSRFFPPQDPWLSGYAISYYYFGYVMLAALIRLTGVLPEIGFNLGVAMWYALTLAGAFGLSFDLVGLARARLAQQTAASPARPPIGYGLLGALFVGVLGNLEGVVEAAYHRSLVPLSWIQWLNIKELTQNLPTGNWVGGFWWWWRASRVVHDQLLGRTLEVIDEFPFFSFLLGDLHPHVLALPFVLLAIALALALMLEASAMRVFAVAGEPDESAAGARRPAVLHALAGWAQNTWQTLGTLTGLGSAGVVLSAVVLGGLAFLNTWDYPIYLALTTLAIGAGLATQTGLRWPVIGRALSMGLLLGLLGALFYLPFYIGFQSQAGGLLPNLFFPTRLSQFFVMFGPFLVLVVALLWVLSRESAGQALRRGTLTLLPWMLAPPLFLGLFLLAGLVLPQGRIAAQALLNNGDVSAVMGERSLDQVVALALSIRLTTPWTYLLLAGLLVWSGGVLWAFLGGRDAAQAESMLPGGGRAAGVAPLRVQERQVSVRFECRDADIFALLLVVLAVLLTVSVEFVFLRDFFALRMNTVFKFYYQAWILLALAAAYGVSRLAERSVPAWLGTPALALAGLLVLGGLYYPLQATPSKANDFTGSPALDGLDFMRQYNPADLAAIGWLRENAAPDAVVLEAPGGSYSSEGAQRVSMSTGNPTLLGWEFHERQWRGEAYDRLVAGRPEAIERIYRTGRPEELVPLLEQWDVDYVFVGGLERRKYGLNDVTLVRFDRALRKVYDVDGVRIYAR